jgi:hypothetical protein
MCLCVLVIDRCSIMSGHFLQSSEEAFLKNLASDMSPITDLCSALGRVSGALSWAKATPAGWKVYTELPGHLRADSSILCGNRRFRQGNKLPD